MLVEKQPTRLIERLSEIEQEIGNTPLIPIRKLNRNENVQVFAKVEYDQFGGSVKSRPAFQIIKNAILRGDLDESKVLIDATSGNTGIAYAFVCAALKIPLVICMPENASEERKAILVDLGADLVLTSPFESTEGAQVVARKLAEEDPDRYYYADQYSNEDNWKAHYYGTAEEIIDQTRGEVTHFVAGLGTTGTMTGTGRKLKEYRPAIQRVALQPKLALHGLEGWKHIPSAGAPAIYDPAVHDQIIEVSTDQAYQMIIDAKQQEGLFLSPSSAANLFGALALADQLDEGVVVTILPDNSEKYSEIIDSLFK